VLLTFARRVRLASLRAGRLIITSAAFDIGRSHTSEDGDRYLMDTAFIIKGSLLPDMQADQAMDLLQVSCGSHEVVDPRQRDFITKRTSIIFITRNPSGNFHSATSLQSTREVPMR